MPDSSSGDPEKTGKGEKPRAYNRVKTLRRDLGSSGHSGEEYRAGQDGLSRQELAEAVGISPATLGNIEREEYEPGVLLACRIAEYFELPLEAVFSPEPIPPLSQTLGALYPYGHRAVHEPPARIPHSHTTEYEDHEEETL